MPLLELHNVTKRYGTQAVLEGIDLAIDEGEFCAIVGYSGAGKTTLISLLSGLIRPDAGQVLFESRPVLGPGPDRGVVFQNYSLLPWLSVFSNVKLAVDQVFPKMSAAERKAHVEKYIAMVNLSPALHKLPRELSGGMRQRVSVARALAMQPKVLLMDEPLSALDALTRAQLQDELVSICRNEGKTVVLITNDVDEGLLTADRIIPLSAGPGARLGPTFPIDIARPRDRKALNHDERFRHTRAQVIEWLIGPGKRPGARPIEPAKPAVAAASSAKNGLEITDLSIGFVPLSDAAPFIVAFERGLFKKHGLNVRLRRQSSWNKAIDGLCDGTLHASHLLASLPVASAVGLLGPRRPTLCFPWIASRNGQAITLACEFERKVNADAAALKPMVDSANAEDRAPTFAITHPLGTHAMWLRYWLGAGGIHPDVDVNLVTVPPPAMVASLRRGDLSGMSVGEPWNAVAAGDNVGFTAITSQEIWTDHPEKVCGFTEDFVLAHPNTVKAVCKALHEASVWLDEPVNRPAAASMMSPAHYVNCPAPLIERRLVGDVNFGDGRRKDFGDLAVTFSRRNANFPQRKYAKWFLSQFRRWGMLDAAPDYDAIAQRVARVELYEQAMSEIGYRTFGEDGMPEILFDGHVFDASDPEAYARSFRVNTMSDELIAGGAQ